MVFHIIEQTATRRFQDALRSVQEPFKRLQDASKRLPKGLQTPPRTFQERPRHLQDTPKSTPRRLQVRTKRPPGAQEAARDAQEPAKRVQEPPRVPQELSRSTPRSLQERAKRLLKLNPKMLQRLYEPRGIHERSISKIRGPTPWVGGTRERGYNPPHTFGEHGVLDPSFASLAPDHGSEIPLGMLPYPRSGHRVPPIPCTFHAGSMQSPCRLTRKKRQDATKMAPRALKMPSRRFKSPPRRSKNPPRALRMRSRRSKSPPRGPRCLEERQDASRTSLGTSKISRNPLKKQ